MSDSQAPDPCPLQTGISLEVQQDFLTTCLKSKNLSTAEYYPKYLKEYGATRIAYLTYPEEVHNLLEAMMGYDEPVHPIPVGASIFYFIMIAWICTFYFTYLGRKFLVKVKQKLDLYPDPNKFPSLPLYWLQQTKREADLRREVRNTWAWLAKRYLLSPNDPLLANVDQVLGLVNWHDFEVCRNTWSLTKVILRLNALFLRITRDHQGGEENEKRTFEIVPEAEVPRIPVDGDMIQYVYDEEKFKKKYMLSQEKHKETENIEKVDTDTPMPQVQAQQPEIKTEMKKSALKKKRAKPKES